MADTHITSKSEFATLAATLKTKLAELKTDAEAVKTKAKSATDYDGIDVTGPASTLANNFTNIYNDLETAAININNYATDILGFDVNDFLANGGEMPIKYEDLFKSDGSMEGNAQAVWNFLKYKGLSDAAAAGVMGNIQAECNFRLTAVGDGGTSYGLIQWHAGRKSNLINWCNQNGYDPSSLQGQLEFLWYESLDPNSSYGRNLTSQGFYTTDDPVTAAVIFHNVVEKSASSQDTVRSKRGGYATSWYNKYQGTGPTNVDGSLTLSSKSWSSTVPSSSGGYTNTGAYVSGGSSSGGSYYGGSSSVPTTSTPTPTTTTETTTTTTTTTETTTTELTREEKLVKMEEVKAQKVKLNFGSKDADTSKFSDYPDLGIKVTAGHMSYELTDDDVNLLCSIVAASGGKGYDDSLSIISSILNRCENSIFMTKYGIDPIAQVTASGQYSGYTSGDFKSFFAGTSEISDETREAVKAALAGIRNHNKTDIISIAGKAAETGSTGTDTSSGGKSLLDALKESNDNFEAQGNTPDTSTGGTTNDLDDLGVVVDETSISIQ